MNYEFYYGNNKSGSEVKLFEKKTTYIQVVIC